MISPTITAVFTVGYLLVTLYLCRGLRLGAREQALGGAVSSLTLVLAAIYIPLPTGASITAGSMIPLMLLALVYDRRLAFVAGWVTGLLTILLIPAWQPVHWAQVFVEHLVAFSCLGYAATFGSDRKWKVLLGVLLAITLRFIGQVLSGVIFFSQNAWDGWGAWAYSITYHLSSKVPEFIVSAAVLLVLPLDRLRQAVRGGKA